MKSECRKAFSPLPVRWVLLFVVLLPLATHAVFCQTAAEADAVKSLIRSAEEERPLLSNIVAAHDSRELESLSPVSRIGRMMHSLQLYRIAEERGSIAVLRSLPRNDIEMEALNEFTHKPANKEFREAYREYYHAAFKSVTSHSEYLHAVFQVTVEFDTKNWPDYDDIDWYCGELSKVYKEIPSAYEHALAHESARNRKLLRACAHGH